MKYSAFKDAVLGQTQKFFDLMDEVIANPTLDDDQKLEEFIHIGKEFDMDPEQISQLEVA